MNKSKSQHKFFYYNHKNSTIGSLADAGLPEVYLFRMESLTSAEVTNHTAFFSFKCPMAPLKQTSNSLWTKLEFCAELEYGNRGLIKVQFLPYIQLIVGNLPYFVNS